MSYLYLIYVIDLHALMCGAKNASVEIHPNVSPIVYTGSFELD